MYIGVASHQAECQTKSERRKGKDCFQISIVNIDDEDAALAKNENGWMKFVNIEGDYLCSSLLINLL